jgi:benzoyl-CoA 2,3-dioxygenase component B
VRLVLPSSRLRRAIGAWAEVPTDPAGRIIDRDEFERQVGEWLPSQSDREFVRSLMRRVVEPGRVAAWIAPPDRGINSLAVDYEYVRLN